MTHQEIASAKKIGFQRFNSPYGHLLWRRINRCMTVVMIRTGEEKEEDLDQEPRVEVAHEDDLAGNQAWAELIAETME